MSIVWAWRGSVGEYVAAGQRMETPLPECPGCRRQLGRWSGYWRWVRYPVDQRRIWIRRTRCASCRSSHALLPDFLFVRRLDEVATLARFWHGEPRLRVELRTLARQFEVPRETLRGWWDRLRARADAAGGGARGARGGDASDETQSDLWIRMNPRAARQQGAPVRFRIAAATRPNLRQRYQSSARKSLTFLPTLLPNRVLACRRARPGARFELEKGASGPLAQLDVVVEETRTAKSGGRWG